MSYPTAEDISRGIVVGARSIHKFGRNAAVGASYAPVSIGGIYRTPQPANATALRIKAGGNANDTAAGTGAREITILGLNASGSEITETIATAGASASAATQQTFIRLYRAYVSQSGTYASQTAGSHVGSIVIENAAGGTDWATIFDTTFPRSQTQIAVYSIPRNRSAIITDMNISSDADKKANVILFQRQNILQTSAPYDGMRVVEEFTQVSGLHNVVFSTPLGPFPELTDIGFMARSTSTSIDMAISFNIQEFLP
jgi:hypothetical protein